jgi:hypothetical protein
LGSLAFESWRKKVVLDREHLRGEEDVLHLDWGWEEDGTN